MIHDTIENSALYETLNPNFGVAFSHLRTTDFDAMWPCEYSLNDDVRVIVSVAEGRGVDRSQVEVHNEFVDIQMPLNTTETMGWAARGNLRHESVAYNPQTDIAFYTDSATDFVAVKPGEFVVFFPTDGHQPCIAEKKIKKVIVKVRGAKKTS